MTNADAILARGAVVLNSEADDKIDVFVTTSCDVGCSIVEGALFISNRWSQRAP